MTRAVRLEPVLALALAACLVPWYAGLLADVPGLLERDDVLGHADSGAFARLVGDFDLARRYGDPVGGIGVDPHANAQKHKLHHVLYAVVGSAIAGAARRLPGVGPRDAVLLVNALLGAINAFLVFVLCGRTGPAGPMRFVAMALFGAALSTLVLAAQPDSWGFTATLVLGVLVLQRDPRVPRDALAALVGIAMLNNVLLALLAVPLVLEALAAATARPRDRLLALGRAPALALATWLAALCALALVEEAFRPDRFVAHLLWFRRFDAAYHAQPWHDPATCARTVAMALLGSISSAPPNIHFVPTAAASTLRGGGAPAAAIWGVALLVGWAAVRFVRTLRAARAAGTARRALLRDPSTILAVHVAAGTAAILLTSWPSAFLYSPLLTGPLVVFVHAQLAPASRAARGALVAVAALVIAVNVRTVTGFAARLRGAGAVAIPPTAGTGPAGSVPR